MNSRLTWEEEHLLREGERIDDLQRGGRRIIQNPAHFCFGMDAVLLSAFARVRPDENVLDLCSGSGVIPILLCERSGGGTYTGLEINEECADMAGRSVRLNGLQDAIEIIRGDVREAGRIFPAASFDVVTSNPPYMRPGHGLENSDLSVAAARHEILCTLTDVVKAARHVLGNGGRFYLVHRPFRLGEIFAVLMREHFEPKRMQLVYPYADREPNMVLIEARLGARSGMRVEKPLIIYRSPGIYTDEVLHIYQD